MNFMCESAEFNGPVCKKKCARCKPAKPRWCIQIQRRAEFKGGDQGDWRRYRDFMVWPKTFATSAEAHAFLASCFTFKSIQGRKVSASVRACSTVARVEGLRR